MPEPKLEGLIAEWLKGPTVTLRVRSTAGWGCPCPPFTLRETGDYFVFAEVPPTMLDPEVEVLHAGPKMEFVLEGSYTGRTDTLERRAAAKGERPPEGSRDAPASPVFRVVRWCVRPPPEALERGASEPWVRGYVEGASYAEKNGLVCPK
jgi:hypothetical protein